jgi:hypothetical protein
MSSRLGKSAAGRDRKGGGREEVSNENAKHAMAIGQVDWEIHTISRSSTLTLPGATFFDHLSSK